MNIFWHSFSFLSFPFIVLEEISCRCNVLIYLHFEICDNIVADVMCTVMLQSIQFTHFLLYLDIAPEVGPWTPTTIGQIGTYKKGFIRTCFRTCKCYVEYSWWWWPIVILYLCTIYLCMYVYYVSSLTYPVYVRLFVQEWIENCSRWRNVTWKNLAGRPSSSFSSPSSTGMVLMPL